MSFRRPVRIVPFLITGLVLCACSGDAGSESSSAGTEVTADLLGARESLAADPQRRMSTSGADPGEMGEWLTEQLPARPIPLDTLGFDLGDPDAPVKILEFSDFGCGYCRQFHLETFPTLYEEYIEAGDVYWKYVPILLGIFPNSVEAAQVGECVGVQGRFLEVSDLLFQRQSEWKQASDPMPVLYQIAADAGANVEEVRACVESERQAGRIAAGTAYSVNSGLRGTPTFFIVGYTALPGAIPLDLFSEIIDSVKVDVARGGGAPNLQR